MHLFLIIKFDIYAVKYTSKNEVYNILPIINVFLINVLLKVKLLIVIFVFPE